MNKKYDDMTKISNEDRLVQEEINAESNNIQSKGKIIEEKIMMKK